MDSNMNGDKNGKSVAPKRPTLDGVLVADPETKTEVKAELPKEEKKQSIKPKRPNFLNKIKQLWRKTTKKQRIIGLAVLAGIIVVIGGLLLTMYLTSPVHITKVETTRAISSRTENPPVLTEFAGNDPIMLYLEYADAKVGMAINFEVKDQAGEVVKSGATTVLRETGDDKADGQRYISIVNTASTALPTGKYRIILAAEGREVGAINFEITE